MSSRYERERHFHDQSFAEHSRRGVSKFYRIAGASNSLYVGILKALVPGGRVLEYGCGAGSHAFLLARYGAQVTGIDISETAIQQAYQRAIAEELGSKVALRVMNAEHLEFPANAFDVVCGTGILHHLSLERAYSELVRVLTSGGAAVFVEPLGHNPWLNLWRRLTPHLRTEDEHPLHMNDLRLASHYFDRVECRFFHFSSALALAFLKVPPLFRMSVKFLDGVDRILFALVPPLRSWAWLVVMVMDHPKKTLVEPESAGTSNADLD